MLDNLTTIIQGNSENLYKACVAIVLGYTIMGWLTLTGIKINYGRLSSSPLNFYINAKIAWFLFEIPNLLWAGYFLFVKGQPLSFGLGLFIVHYINRDIIYPLRLRTQTTVPFEIAFSAFIFTFANGYLQCVGNLTNLMTGTPIRTIIGTVVFVVGMAINIHSDNILQKAKEKSIKDMKEEESATPSGDASQGKVAGKKKYAKIDQFLFKYVSNPNYFGEIIEWFGYAIVCWHLQGLMFAMATLNILIPAAIVRSRWNHANIQGYPKERKAVFPFLL